MIPLRSCLIMFSSSELKDSKKHFNQVLLQTFLVYRESKTAILNRFSFQCLCIFTSQSNVCFLFDLHLIFTRVWTRFLPTLYWTTNVTFSYFDIQLLRGLTFSYGYLHYQCYTYYFLQILGCVLWNNTVLDTGSNRIFCFSFTYPVKFNESLNIFLTVIALYCILTYLMWSVQLLVMLRYVCII